MKHDYYPMPKPDMNAGKGNQGEKPDTHSDPSGRGTMGHAKGKTKGYGKTKP